jgi:hypothetical protein
MTLHEANGVERQITCQPRARSATSTATPQSDHYVLTRRDGSQRVVQLSVVRGRAKRDGDGPRFAGLREAGADVGAAVVDFR